ncbi:TetR/AcrR family transcriptional regulator [Halanaerobium sp.]|jgi:AcrR family transcriptional regulator|uniref:TetR/AcrR family transcriptional regulator n=1 Tax=Halanaerobium sp. TaxID=1895664 RepID=UPI000DE73BBC|nr:TetR/AcrR family transcriptional regulator [Halanaerobium sp.]PUU93833.1 MAG: regulatory protein TetR [Halanaerobium sp.]
MIDFDRKDIKKKRTLKIFIEATREIIEENGINNVTIRGVAKKAGYNSATIYNYFDNCKQLIFFASLDFLGEYSQAMPNYIADADDEIDRFIKMWECFCKYSFENPKIYYAIFTDNIGDHPEILMKKYFDLFPEKLGTPSADLLPMLLDPDLSHRAAIASKPLIEGNFLHEKKARQMDNMITYIYHGMLTLMVNKRIDYNSKEALKIISNQIKSIVENAICCHQN